MNVVEKLEKTILDKVSENTGNPDIKKVLQDTRASLESLKKSVDEKKITNTNNSSSINYLKDCMAKIDNVQGLTVSEKEMLKDIKSQIEAKDIEAVKIADIIAIVSALEERVENLSVIDQEKIKELVTVNVQHKVMLDGLKTIVVEGQEKLKEKKQEYITKVKEDLEKHRWSAWLAKPAYDFLMKKYIYKKEIGKFEDFLMGTVGLTIVGRFVSKDLKGMINKIDTISLEDIKNIDEKIKEKKIQAEERAKEVKQKIGPKIKNQVEKVTGKKIDDKKFAQTFTTRVDKRKGEANIYTSEQKQIFENVLNNSGNEVDVAGDVMKGLFLPVRAGMDLMFSLAGSGVISRSDVIINGVLKKTGESVLSFGIGAVGLFANTIKWVLGSIDTDELRTYANEHISKLSPENKIAIRATIYRHGGWFRSIAGALGQATGEGLSVLFMQRTGGDIGKMSAYWKGGVLGDLEKQVQVFKQVENSVIGTGMFADKKGSDILEDMIQSMKKNMSLFDIAQNAKTFPELEKLLIANGHTDILKTLKSKKYARGQDLGTIKKAIGNEIEVGVLNVTLYAEDSFGRINKFMGKHVKLPRSKYSGEVEMIERFKDFSKLQGKLLQSGEMFHGIRNQFRKFEVGKQLVGMVEYGDKVRFRLKNVKDAKDFFDNVRYIGKSSPETLKVLFKGFPLIMVGNEVLNQMKEHPEDSMVKDIMKGIGYMTPFVGPIMLFREGLKYDPKSGDFKDLTAVGVSVGLFGYDTYSLIKAGNLKGIKGVFNFFAMPIRDSRAFTKAIGEGTYGFMKMTRDGFRVLTTGEGVLAFGEEALRFLKGSGLRLAGIAVLIGLGYWGYKELFDNASKEEKEELAKLNNKSNEEMEGIINKEWTNMNDNQKAAVIKVATAQKLQIANLDNVSVNKTGNQINVTIKTLVPKNTLGQAQFEIQESVSKMEGGNQKTIVQYSLDGGEIKYELLGKKKEYFTDENGNFDKNVMVEYLLSMGYDTNEVNVMMDKIA